ncbi:unnamed protein product [Miscanthus lutarioriparius]|uniref:Uncharacterized protein n=1 Tax=Miscanthus lutarioriparius TaxID=422564 RepID=A0A811NI35_9POAL|nr:unnamed protein product [Miscanthus lutarioriparius]
MPGDGLLRRWFVCMRPARREARLVLWGGGTWGAEPGRAAGEVMAEHAGHVVCRADGFRVGRPAPVLGVGDRLEAGRTYLVVPVDRLPCGGDGVVTAASLAALSSSSHSSGGGNAAAPSLALVAAGRKSPFEYAKDGDGRTVIRVAEEFIVRAIAGDGGGGGGDGCGSAALCSTPELRKHYEQLVGATRGRPWSPRLDTIKERKGRRLADVVSPGRLSPVRLLGMDKDKGLSFSIS